METKNTITIGDNKYTVITGKTEISYGNEKISISAPSIIIQEFDK